MRFDFLTAIWFFQFQHKIGPLVVQDFQHVMTGDASLIVYLKQTEFPSEFVDLTWGERGAAIYDTLTDYAASTQGQVMNALEPMIETGAVSRARSFKIINEIAVDDAMISMWFTNWQPWKSLDL